MSMQETVSFLTSVFQAAPEGAKFSLCWKSGSGRGLPSKSFDSIEALASKAWLLEEDGIENIWFRTTPMGTHPTGGRGEAADTIAVTTLWADLDFVSENHKSGNLPADAEAARTLITTAGLPDPTYVVHTGGGLAAYWVLAEAATPEVGAELEKRVVSMLRRAANGLTIDGVQDLARIMRLPGTTNRKYGAANPCEVIESNGALYGPDDFPEPEPFTAPKAPEHVPDPLFDSAGREGEPRRFTLQQALEFVSGKIAELRNAQDGSINTALRDAARICFHFGQEFWSRADVEKQLKQALEHTDYDGKSWDADDTIESAWKHSLTGWKAVFVPTDATPDDEARFDAAVIAERFKRRVRETADRMDALEKPRGRLRDRILTESRLAEIPGVEPLIGSFLFKRSVAVVYGRRNVGKTFLALDMALSVATGRDWTWDGSDADWKINPSEGFPTEKAKVLWVAGEGAYGIRSRVAAWKKQHEVTGELDFHVLNGSVELADGHITDELCAIVKEEGYGLIVVDTLARNSAGLEENSNTDMGTFFERLDRIKNAHDGACVLVVHHAGKSETSTESRGASSIEDAPDTVLKLSGDEVHIFFETTKQRDTVKHARLDFHLQAVDGTSSAVILPGRGYVAQDSQAVQATKEMQVREVFMALFSNTGCTGSEWRAAIMEKMAVSRSVAQEYLNKAVEGWDAVIKVEGGRGKSDRYEVA